MTLFAPRNQAWNENPTAAGRHVSFLWHLA